MTACAVYTAKRDGTERVALGALGNVAGLTFSTSWPGGCLTAQWSLDVPATFAHPAITPGRIVSIYNGGGRRAWIGTLEEPDRGAPWACHAKGLQSVCGDYLAIDASGLATSSLNTALAQAISRGLPVLGSNPATLPTPTLSSNAAGTVADLANAVATASGQRWGLFADQLLTMQADRTTVDYVYALTDTFGRTLDGYATDIYATYLNSGTTPPTLASVAASTNPATSSTRPFGRIEKSVDLTNAGPMTGAQAQSYVNGITTLLGQQVNFSNVLAVQPGQLLTLGGLAVDLSTVTAGQVIRVVGAQPDTVLGEVNYSAGISVVIGECDYDTVSGIASITPVNATRSDPVAVLTATIGAANNLSSTVLLT